jgi:ADP-ribosylglycohydrolase
MERNIVRMFLEALAVGDAFGKVTEYCSLEDIKQKLGRVEVLLTPEESLTHNDLAHGQVTDDTEQNLYLIRQFAEDSEVTAENTAEALLKWVDETDAKKYMGPSSSVALEKIKNGEDIKTTGLNGTTSGGIMRIPAAFLFSTVDSLVQNVVACLLPTHNTGVAMDAAMTYAYALQAAVQDNPSISEICDAAYEGSLIGRKYGSQKRTAAVAPGCGERVRYLQECLPSIKDEQALKEHLYYVLGTTCSSWDVCSAVFGIFLWAKDDVFTAIRISTEVGGDTDTIACLVACLSALYAKGHNIPEEMVQLVADANDIDFEVTASLVSRK